MHFTTAALFAAALALQTAAMPNPNPADNGLSKRYTRGQCGVHFQQFQKNEGPGADTSQYRLTIVLKDAVGAVIGGVAAAQAPPHVAVNVDSQLPFVFEATALDVDSDPLNFAYNGQNFDSSSGQCSVGGYDSGSRLGDCGFSC